VFVLNVKQTSVRSNDLGLGGATQYKNKNTWISSVQAFQRSTECMCNRIHTLRSTGCNCNTITIWNVHVSSLIGW